jgi:hypothetical protein
MDHFHVGMIGIGVDRVHVAALHSIGLFDRGFPPIDLMMTIATATEASGQLEPNGGIPASAPRWTLSRYSSRLKPI